MRRFSTRTLLCANKRQRVLEEQRVFKNSVNRALDHYDDLYASVFTNKWPSLRLGLLTTPKYMAVPNIFTGNMDKVITKLDSLGALDVHKLWKEGKARLAAEAQKREGQAQAQTEDNDEDRIKEMDQTLHSIAETKTAEEIDTLYQNAPAKKFPVRATEGLYDDRRVMSDVSQASQEFITATKLKGLEEFLLESEYFAFYAEQKPSESSFYKFTTPETSHKVGFPFIRPYTFEAGSSAAFPSSGKDRESGLRDYLCVNGSSIAPIIALDLKPEKNVLDLCSGPGTKSLLSLMTLCPTSLTCNDVEANRLLRVKNIFHEFTGERNPDNVKFTRSNATTYQSAPAYDRVLADVPCSSDRVSATVPFNNIFRSTRLKERLGLVQVQKRILLSAFKSLSNKEGSACVYSTCTLSPIENDGAVAAALKETEVGNLAVDLVGLWEALWPLKLMHLFNISRTKFGILIEPNVISNFGPMYISRIVVQS